MGVQITRPVLQSICSTANSAPLELLGVPFDFNGGALCFFTSIARVAGASFFCCACALGLPLALTCADARFLFESTDSFGCTVVCHALLEDVVWMKVHRRLPFHFVQKLRFFFQKRCLRTSFLLSLSFQNLRKLGWRCGAIIHGHQHYQLGLSAFGGGWWKAHHFQNGSVGGDACFVRGALEAQDAEAVDQPQALEM
jgi:hypothetical protein